MMYPGWIRGKTQPEVVGLEAIVDHMDRICQFAGNTRHIALGTDLDGGYGTEQTPHDLDTITDIHKLEEILARRGYSSGILMASSSPTGSASSAPRCPRKQPESRRIAIPQIARANPLTPGVGFVSLEGAGPILCCCVKFGAIASPSHRNRQVTHREYDLPFCCGDGRIMAVVRPGSHRGSNRTRMNSWLSLALCAISGSI